MCILLHKQFSDDHSSTTTDYFWLFSRTEQGSSSELQVALRTAVASSQQTPPEVLSRLASDPTQQVRLAIATNPATPGLILEQLASDCDVYTGCRAPELSVSSDILVALMQNRNPYIRKQAKLSWDGREFEKLLENSGLILVAGSDYRLGELLVASQLVNQVNIDNGLRDSQLHRIPLARALLQSKHCSSTLLLAALKYQGLIRQGKMSAADGIRQLNALNDEEILTS